MSDIDLTPGPPGPQRLADMPPREPPVTAAGPPGAAPPGDVAAGEESPLDLAMVRGVLRAISASASMISDRTRRAMTQAERDAVEEVIYVRFGGVRPLAFSDDEVDALAPALLSMARRYPALEAAIRHADWLTVLSWMAHYTARQFDQMGAIREARHRAAPVADTTPAPTREEEPQ